MIRICPERDAACPAGMSCPYAKDRYACVPGWEGLDKSHNPEGFTPALESACRERCAEFGEPPCWRLPELVSPCEHITPCDECRAEVDAREPSE